MSIFICPHCGKELFRSGTALHCSAGHTFDRSAEGYVHLLPVNKKHSKQPGDSPQMVQARNQFLSKGYYEPLRNALCSAVSKAAVKTVRPVILDCGCGEGYYTEEICRRTQNAAVYGVDISKTAVKKAAKRTKKARFAVASVYRLPVSDRCIDFLINVFAPLSAEEYNRVLKPGGKMFYVVPGENHLWQMKQILYETPYKNPEEKTEYPGFVYEDIINVSERIQLGRQDLLALFSMTPYLWRTPKEGMERLRQTESLDTQIEFAIHIFRKKED